MNARKFFSRVGFSFFALIVLDIVIELVLDVILTAFAPGAVSRWPSLWWVVVMAPQYLVAMPVCVLILKRLPAMQIRQNGLGGRSWFRMLCISLFIMIVGSIIGDLLCSLISRLTPLNLSSTTTNMMMTGNLWVVFLFTVIIAPVIEELIFRKVLIDRTIVFGDRTAIIMSGLLFGLIHGNFYQFFYAFGLGCLFAYVYIRTGKIRHTISFHMIVNFLGGFVGVLLLQVFESVSASGSFQEFYFSILAHFGVLFGLLLLELLPYVLAIAGLIMFCITFRRRTLFTGEYAMPAGETGKALFGNAGMILFLISAALMFVSSMIG